jgi:hypothetical protein
MHRENDTKEWEVKYGRLKQLYEESAVVKIKDRDLVIWLSRLKRLARSVLLDPTRQERLTKLGITEEN